MIIDLSRTTRETTGFEKEFAPNELVLDEQTTLAETLYAKGSVRCRDEEAFLQGSIKGRLRVVCSRCLMEMTLPVDTEIVAHFVTIEQYTAQKNERLSDDEEFQMEIYDGAKVDLAEVVREQILVDLPVKNICREDCRGLCPSCGANKNQQQCSCDEEEIDPRWAALKKLKK